MMADDIKKSLKEKITRLEAFSIALDDSTDAPDTAQLAIFIQGVDVDFNITEKLLALQPLKGTTTSEDIFETFNTVFGRFGLKWSSLSGICTDGAPAMVGARKGLIGMVHERTIELQIHPENLTNFHCIIHQQNLCAKSIKSTNVMEVVVAIINFIKSRALNHRQFKEYLADLFSDYDYASYYCEVRWLSKGQMLKRFYDLRQDIADFIDIKRNTINQEKDDEWVCDLAFLVDVTGYLNELNLKLQKQG
jgi:glutaredoxin-related protein